MAGNSAPIGHINFRGNSCCLFDVECPGCFLATDCMVQIFANGPFLDNVSDQLLLFWEAKVIKSTCLAFPRLLLCPFMDSVISGHTDIIWRKVDEI